MSPPLLQEVGLFPGPEDGILPSTWESIIQGDTHADKERDYVGKGSMGREQGKGTQQSHATMYFALSGFMVMGYFSSCLWPIIFTKGPSWWCAHHSTKKDSSEKDSGKLAGHRETYLLSHFALSQILLVVRSLLVSRPLPGLPVVRKLV